MAASMGMTTQERQLCQSLRDLPRICKNRYDDKARKALLASLFWSLAGGQEAHMRLLFPEGSTWNGPWNLRKAQGAVDGAEYTEAARGKACGHIFKSGEATYKCKTCSADDTCVLCSKCYEASNHEGHMVYISITSGNSGCCDCGDPEAWRQPVHCGIHSEDEQHSKKSGKSKEAAGLPADLVESIRMTIGRAFDYICDVISCSPEHLRIAKTVESIQHDERMSRLTSEYYDGDVIEEPTEYALLLWNDEKHTVSEVRDQVSRACKVTTAEALMRAHETDDVGRTIVKFDTDIERLLGVSKIIEQIKVTVSIRSARDTFREQMCGTIVEWLGDISGCSVGDDHNILRYVVCEEMLKEWHTGSQASNAMVGKDGIDDHEVEDRRTGRQNLILLQVQLIQAQMRAAAAEADDESDSDVETRPDDGIDSEEEEDIDLVSDTAMEMVIVDTSADVDTDGDVDMTEDDPALEVREAAFAGYPAPPPPPPPPPPAPIDLQRTAHRDRELSPSDSDTAEPLIPSIVYSKGKLSIPKTPGVKPSSPAKIGRPPSYWLETPEAFVDRESIPIHEDLWQRVRLDWMVLFDLRMWKKVRVGLRDLYISTVVTIPQFKRVLGLRFAGLYTLLAQLYLIADREPDHSIINISLQMLTTPSITSEIVERGNFLTHLMAILFTFLTTRQVSPPYEINPNAVLKFESGSVTNRRMYHFFMDLRYLFGSEYVQEKLRTEERYMMQFLDLVKLHQGICPNVRAVGEHVEYETDAWISASLVTREINRLCRQFSESFKWKGSADSASIYKAIRLAAKAVILNSLGTERKRFESSEIREEVKFKKVGGYEFDATDSTEHKVIKFVVEEQPISFHHALHSTLSWLIECGKSMSRNELANLLSFTTEELKQKPKAMGHRVMTSRQYSPEDHLMAAFDYPLRVCAWLAQMKASMWVRNGMSLRHQAATYRGVSQRDVSHHRDIFLIQTAMVICPPGRVLASMIDRFGMEMWLKGIYEQKSDSHDDSQHLDVAEDMIHLLIVLLSDRTSLVSIEDEPNLQVLAMRRDITHVLCLKPLSFSEICSKLPDKFQELEECQDILDEMTNFKPPEGLSDVGTFELKEQFLDEIDPYIAHYNKNQREESENAYRAWMAKKTGKAAEDIVYEPKLRLIESGVFVDLSAFTRTGLFAQIIYYSLLYPLRAEEETPAVNTARVEAFLHVVLHLVLVAVLEDKAHEDDTSEESLQSFVYTALARTARLSFAANSNTKTIVAVLEMLSTKEVFKACHPKIALILKRMKQKRPRNFELAFTRLGVPIDRVSTASPASLNAGEEQEKKKQLAKERQAKVMAQFQQQQKSFLDNQGDIDWGEDETSDEDIMVDAEDQKKYWKYPSGTCILCQEETNDVRPYGTFAMFTDSSILRLTNFSDADFVREVSQVPMSLDRSAEAIRPFGVAGENRIQVHKITSDGSPTLAERQIIAKGFWSDNDINPVRRGPVAVGCGHIMHYKCFETYNDASHRRHTHQIARHHPERLDLNEFCCPLCKAQGNAFLPIIWRGIEESYPSILHTDLPFELWLDHVLVPLLKRAQKSAEPGSHGNIGNSHYQERFVRHNRMTIMPPLASKLSQLQAPAWIPKISTPTSLQSARSPPLSAPGAFPVDGSTQINAAASHPWDATDAAMIELVSVYKRLGGTIKRNNLHSDHIYEIGPDPGDFVYSDTLAKALGFSISAFEIQQRGVESGSCSTFVEMVPQPAITHLRILAETAISYVTVGGLRFAGSNRTAAEYSKDFDRQLFQLFVGHGQIFGSDPDWQKYDALLNQDSFVFLAECSLCLTTVLEIDVVYIARLCYIAEIVKAIMEIGRHSPVEKWLSWIGLISGSNYDGEYGHFRNACATVTRIDMVNLVEPSSQLTQARPLGFDLPFICDIESCRSFVRRYALTFLRKVALLFHVRYGTDFSHTSPIGDDELERLTSALMFPSFDDCCATICSVSLEDKTPTTTQSMVHGWMHHQAVFRGKTASTDASEDSKTRTKLGRIEIKGEQSPMERLSLPHPAIFELVGLPKNYDTLMEEATRRRCPTTGKDVSDPMLCLFCGKIICGQAFCCLVEETVSPGRPARQIGGAQQHMRKCQQDIGLFINIRKCTVLYLHHLSGSWMVAPYIDKYGEVDPGLRHGRQLFLNQKRYDALLRTVWLQHGVPSVISRKLEADINNGGWETI